MLWHFILTMTWKSTRLTHINATSSRHDVLHPSEKSYAIVDDRVCLDLILACDLFSTKVKRFVLQNFHIYTFTFYQRMSKLDVYFLNYLLWCTSATSVARWSIPQITCLLSSLVRARVSVLDASVLSLRYAAPSLHFSIRDGISPANRGNFVYCISCHRCPLLYIVETEGSLRSRFRERLRSIRNNTPEFSMGQHFNSTGPSIPDVQVRGVGIALCSGADIQQKQRKMRIFLQLGTVQPKGRNIDFSFIWTNIHRARAIIYTRSRLTFMPMTIALQY